MKKVLTILAIIFLLAGCSKNESEPSYIELEPGSESESIINKGLSSGYEAIQKVIRFKTNSNWSISSDVTWVKCTPTSGNPGNVSLTLYIEENPNNDARSTQISLQLGEVNKKIIISQDAKGSTIDPDKEVPDPHGTITLNVSSASNDLGFIVKDGNFVSSVGLITNLGIMKGLGNVSHIPKTTWARSISVLSGNGYVAWNSIDNTYIRFYVTSIEQQNNAQIKYQKPFNGAESIISPNKKEVVFSSDANNDTIRFINSYLFPFSNTNKEDWMTVDYISNKGGTPVDAIKISVRENLSVSERNAEFEIYSDGMEKIMIKIKQRAKEAKSQIKYTVNDGKPIVINNEYAFKTVILDNICTGNEGIIYFKDDITLIPDAAFKDVHNLVNITLPEGIETIEKRAFMNCINLKKIDLSSSINSIGESAFANCVQLESINLPKGLKIINNELFSGCKSLKEFVFTDNIEYIGSGAFYSCESILSVNLPASVKGIGQMAFANCKSVKTINIQENVTNIESDAFRDCTGELTINSKLIENTSSLFRSSKIVKLNIGNNIERIGDYAFSSLTSLTSLVLPATIKYIGKEAFSNCNNLSGELSFEQGLETIQSNAFANCEKITNVYIPNSVKTIGVSAFKKCTGDLVVDCSIPESAFAFSNFRSVRFTDNVIDIGNNAFNSCAQLDTIIFALGLQRIGSNAFEGSISLEYIKIPETVKSIGDLAFSKCSSTKEITMPNSVISFGGYIFAGCNGELVVNCNTPDNGNTFNRSKFNKIIFGDKVTRIGSFSKEPDSYPYTNIKTIIIGKNVNSISAGAFMGSHLDTILCYALIPPTLEVIGGPGSAFILEVFNHWNFYLKVPKGSSSSYRSTKWNKARSIAEL